MGRKEADRLFFRKSFSLSKMASGRRRPKSYFQSVWSEYLRRDPQIAEEKNQRWKKDNLNFRELGGGRTWPSYRITRKLLTESSPFSSRIGKLHKRETCTILHRNTVTTKSGCYCGHALFYSSVNLFFFSLFDQVSSCL